jgi:hypothetical protein
MNKEQFIRSKFRSLLSESLNEKVKDISEKLNLDKETKLYKDNEFDYVQEGECKECGSELYEGECKECGWKGDGDKEVMEKNERKLEKISDEEIEDLLGDIKSDMKHSKKGEEDEFEFELELDEKECVECGSSYEMKEKLYGKQHKIDKNKNRRIDSEDFKMLRKQQDEEQLYEVEFNKEMEEGETEESREFAYAARMAKKKGDETFELDGEVFNVKESILYTETDLIDLIERLVKEEKSKFTMKEPKGYREYEKAHRADKKENDDYLKSVAKKMTDYLKGASDDGSKYEMKETKKFPTENGGKRKKYTPSEAVNDYNDAFSYPGQTNLRYEIKPNDEWMESNLVGSSKTGNAQVDEDGNALGNVVPSDTGEKFLNNYKNNYYGDEQANASYKRQTQPVDQAGEHTESGSLKSKRSKKTAQSILNKVDESVNEKEVKKLNEEFSRMQSLMGYNRKTQ